MLMIFRSQGLLIKLGMCNLLLIGFILLLSNRAIAYGENVNSLISDNSTINTCKSSTKHLKEVGLVKLIFRHMMGSRYIKRGPGANIDPATISLVSKEYTDTYPQGLAVSPDGHYVLTRILGKNMHYGLDVLSLPSRDIIASYASDGDVLRARWSPDGKQIAFFIL